MVEACNQGQIFTCEIKHKRFEIEIEIEIEFENEIKKQNLCPYKDVNNMNSVTYDTQGALVFLSWTLLGVILVQRSLSSAYREASCSSLLMVMVTRVL